MSRKTVLLLLLCAGASVLSGTLIAHISWLGRAGIWAMYKQYRFLKVWYEGAGLLMLLYLTFFIINYSLAKVLPRLQLRVVQFALLLGCAAGLLYVYHDFRADISHRLLGERFHLGVYLIWAMLGLIVLHFIGYRRRENAVVGGG